MHSLQPHNLICAPDAEATRVGSLRKKQQMREVMERTRAERDLAQEREQQEKEERIRLKRDKVTVLSLTMLNNH
jgi:hypothetical protein